MKVGIVGTRGIPANYGGFETFAQEVSPVLVEKGFDVYVYCDKNSDPERLNLYRGVKLKYLGVTKTSNPLCFYFLGIYSALKEMDVLLVTGTGGSIFYFLNFFFRKTIITNTDGVESRRAKWSFVKRLFIKLTEILAIKFSQGLVADSKGITKYLEDTYSIKDSNKLRTIEYGGYIENEYSETLLNKHNLEHKKYLLIVARLEPENNIHIILDGFIKSNTDKHLVVVGNLIDNEYVANLLVYRSDKIHFIGGVYNSYELIALRCSAYAYMHGHSVGGTNPSLLEALGCGNLCICHDNIYNREVTENNMIYFDSPESCAKSIDDSDCFTEYICKQYTNIAISRIRDYYNWENIAGKYTDFFNFLKNSF